MKLKPSYLRMAALYQHFATDNKESLTFSHNDLAELFIYESTGKGQLSDGNGYAFGKRNMDITIAMWREDLRNGILFYHELCEDYPVWFLHKVIPEFKHRPETAVQHWLGTRETIEQAFNIMWKDLAVLCAMVIVLSDRIRLKNSGSL